MINRRIVIPAVMAAALLALSLPMMTAAQGVYDPYGRPDYRRDRRDDYYGNYDRRTLRDSVHRVKDRSKDFQKHLDRALDHSRYDGSRFEDHLNEHARDFRNAANDLKNHFDDGRDLRRSAYDARRLLELGTHINRTLAQGRDLDSRTFSDWSQIRQDLRVIAAAYGFRNYSYDDGYYRRDDDYRRRQVPNRRDPWWRRP